MSTVLITGGSGLLGKRLATILADKGYTANLLSRDNKKPIADYNNVYLWDVTKAVIDDAAFTNCDYIIHLAGAGIADKGWTKERKQEIIDSRVKSSNLLYTRLKLVPNKVKAVISASATGYYGATTQPTPFNETDAPANDFLGQCCVAWENSVNQIKALGVRTVIIRTGVVLSTHGGAMEKIASLAKFGPVAAVGSGKQAMPWIHIDDICNIYIKALEDENMSGPYNATSPAKDDNNAFTKALGYQIHRPMLPLPVPPFAIRMMYGEMSVTVLEGSHVTTDKIEETGFVFQFPELTTAIRDLYVRRI
jgi:uncharacterized protein (TIGR01777 family)